MDLGGLEMRVDFGLDGDQVAVAAQPLDEGTEIGKAGFGHAGSSGVVLPAFDIPAPVPDASPPGGIIRAVRARTVPRVAAEREMRVEFTPEYSRLFLVVLLLATGPALAAPPDSEDPMGPGDEKDPRSIAGLRYDQGFNLSTADNRFAIRISAAAQFRYSYVDYDDKVQGNEEDYSNFYLRRARLWWIGHAFDPRFTYTFHLQLEPDSDVNLHDAWLEYRFSPWLRLGAGRFKIGYGLEFMNSGFALDLVDRSIFSGETDIDIGGGLLAYGPEFPGGGTDRFGVDWTNIFTGYPTGGLLLGRSQGVQLRGINEPYNEGFVFEYLAGIWQGRATRGDSNRTDGMLYSARAGFYPFGWIDWRTQGDMPRSERFKLGLILSAYRDDDVREIDGNVNFVGPYDIHDRGYDVALQARYRGLAVDVEWARERFEAELPATADKEWEREGWRIQAGWFIKPRRYQLTARYAQIERMQDPTAEGAGASGLGIPRVWNPASGAFDNTLEKRLTEVTAGFAFYLSGSHAHKLIFDVSRLGRGFAETSEPGFFTPGDQQDSRVRGMVQFFF
jgi:hypothetical protein